LPVSPEARKPLDGGYDMNVFGMILAAFARIVDRRRNHWVEISLERAWSRDLPPRLFDL
jgi:hypothetical protein